MKKLNLNQLAIPAIFFAFLSIFFSAASAANDDEYQPTFFNNSERISAAIELARLLGIEYRNRFDGRDRIVQTLRYCGQIDEALKHDVKNVMFEMVNLTDTLIDNHRGSYEHVFQLLSPEEKLFAVMIAVAETQGVRKGIGISLRWLHPELNQSDVLCKSVIDEASSLPALADKAIEK